MIYKLTKTALFLALINLTSFFFTSAPAKADYDYMPATACQYDVTKTSSGTRGEVSNSSQSSITLYCPIIRIYPRTSNRIQSITFRVYNERSSGGAPDDILVVVAAFGATGTGSTEWQTIREPYNVINNFELDSNQISRLRSPGVGWDQYISATVLLGPGDILFGYSIVWNLE